jgi:hypothetical protein
MAEIADERMLLGKLELLLPARMLQEAFEIMQMTRTMDQRQFGGRFHIARRVFGRQLEKALQDPAKLLKVRPLSGLFCAY